MSQIRLKAAFCLGAALASACCGSTSKSPDWQPPQNEVSLQHFAGDSLSGPLAVADGWTSDPEDSLAISAEILFLESFPAHAFEALSGEADLHTVDGQNPIRVVPIGGSLARVGYGAAAREWRSNLGLRFEELARYDTVLPSGVTVAVKFRSAQDAYTAELARAEQSLRPALVSAGAATPLAKREVSVLPKTMAAETLPMALIAPSSTGGAILWWFEAADTSPTAEEQLARFEECRSHVDSASKAVLAGSAPLDLRDLAIRRLAGAVDALDVAAFHRPALLFLASQAGAPAAQDVAWLADDELLNACVERVLKTLSKLSSASDSDQTAWHLERACYRELASRFAADTLPSELVSVLFRHAGELGRYPGLLEDLLVASENQAQLSAKFVSENLLFLEDRNPAARVRAFDWLEANGAAPAGFDPLASRADRRAVLAEVAQ